MELNLTRQQLLDDRTLGTLTDGTRMWRTLEPTMRERWIDGQWLWSPEFKVQNETAIPQGRYKLMLFHSPKFQRDVPRLIDVPDFDAVEIHIGNYPRNTDACILIGKSVVNSALYMSAQALGELILADGDAIARGEAWITIDNPIPAQVVQEPVSEV